MLVELALTEGRLTNPLTPAQRNDVLQWVGDSTLGHNTPFQAVWNVRDLSRRLKAQPDGKLSFTADGTLVYRHNLLAITTLG